MDQGKKEHKPTDELIKRASAISDPAQRQQVINDIRELRDKYAGTAAEFKAPGGQPSGLIAALGTELGQQAWYAVRTPAFKEWFGDWERAARVTEIENIIPKEITISEQKNKKEIEKLVQSFKQLENNIDGRIVEIPLNTIGKILGHKGYNISKIIENIPSLYETSLLGWSEPEIRREGHKAHPNIKEYHNYINKFSDGSGEYFIRFTLSEEKSKPEKAEENKIHSTAVSDIEIYKKGDHSQRIRDYLPGRSKPIAFYDKRLAEFFNSVKQNSISQIIDEHGEPKPVFHGTNKNFDTFITSNMWGYGGAHFSSNKNTASVFAQGNTIYDVFINLRNPLILDAENKFYDSIPRPKEIPGRGTVDTFELAAFARNNNYDGVIVSNLQEHGGIGTDVISFDPRQIKSVSANIGTYNRDNPSFTDRENIFIKENNMPDIFPDNMTVSDDGKRVFVDMLNQIDGSFGWLPIEKVKEHLQSQKPTPEGKNINIKENSMSDLKDKTMPDIQSNWNKNNPNSPMQLGEPAHEIGSPEHRKEQLEHLEKESLNAAIKRGELKDTSFNRLTAAEIANMPKQGDTPSPERRNINIKENSMSDLNEDLAEEKNLSPRELAFQNTAYQRNMIGAALKNGTCSCLPGKDGYADTTPAMNLANHNFYHGDTLLYLKDHQKKNEFPTGEYLTQAQIEKQGKTRPAFFSSRGKKAFQSTLAKKMRKPEIGTRSTYGFLILPSSTAPKTLKNGWTIKGLNTSSPSTAVRFSRQNTARRLKARKLSARPPIR